MAVYTTTNYPIHNFAPVYFKGGKWAHRIRKIGNAEYIAERANCKRYGSQAKAQWHSTQSAALTWCDNDIQIVKPQVPPTTTTAGFTQPAVNATVAVPVTNATGLIIGQSVTIGTGGLYKITAVAGLSITVQNTGAAGNAAPAAAIPTAQPFTAVPGN
jgi:hypothetical protein